MKKLPALLAAFAFTLASFHARAQNDKESVSIDRYFKLDREGLHLHLNKSVYTNEEQIWFKGYAVQKQLQLPFPETMNVYVSLIDSEGKKVAQNLLYAENATFEGHFALPKDLAAGVYYLQAYTNYMNNFPEDESSVYAITVVDTKSDAFYDLEAVDYDNLNIDFAAESGVFLFGATNTIAVHIADCNGNPVTGTEARIVDPKGKPLAAITTDASGYARFDIADTEMGAYRLLTTIKGKEYSKNLPVPVAEGVAFSVNNYIFADKAAVTIKTNASTLPKLKGREFRFVIQHYNASSNAVFKFDADKTSQSLSIPSDNFSDGLNTIFLIDDKENQLAERIVYKHAKTVAPSELKIAQTRTDSIVVSGISGLKMASLSVSVLPKDASIPRGDIFSKFMLASLKSQERINARYYFTDFSRKKHYELDNLLIAQKPKYGWKNIIGKAPEAKYAFDQGLVLSGTVNNPVADKANTVVNLNSLAFGLNKNAKIDEKNRFEFQNLMVQDSTTVFFFLVDKKKNNMEITLASQLSGNKKTLVKAFEPVAKTCILKPTQRSWDFSGLKSAIRLDSVVVHKKAEPKLNKTNLSRYSNVMANGYKISQDDVTMYSTVVDFIQNHGYAVTQYAGRVVITRNYSTSFFAGNSPQVYVDDMLQEDHSFLTTYRMDMVDEIYINKRGFGGGMGASNGVIRIYLKKTMGNGVVKSKAKGSLIKGGFQKPKSYVNPSYASVQGEAFGQFGTIYWNPDIVTDANGAFRFSFPNLHQETVTVIIEGMGSDRTVYPEVRQLKTE